MPIIKFLKNNRKLLKSGCSYECSVGLAWICRLVSLGSLTDAQGISREGVRLNGESSGIHSNNFKTLILEYFSAPTRCILNAFFPLLVCESSLL